MSETWTEYAVRYVHRRDGAMTDPTRDRESAQIDVDWLARQGWDATLVGRTVTASDWLPVDTDGGRPV